MGRALVVLAALIAAGPARAHDPYSDWKQPSGASCCNDRDCRPTRAWRGDDGWWNAEVNGFWVKVPPRAVLGIVAPDGNSHICINPGGLILCFVAGVPKS